MFTNTYLPHVGGVARSAETFSEDLRKLGWDCLIVAPEFLDATAEAETDPFVVRAPALKNFNGSGFSLSVIQPGYIFDRVEEFAPDIVHSHHPFLLGDAAVRTAATLGLPVVFTHHTLYERYTHYSPVDADVIKRLVIELATDYANLCERVIAPSESIAQLMRSRGVEVPIDVLPTGVDLELFGNGNAARAREQYGIPPDARVIGHVGRLAKEKNLGFLSEAMADCVARDPGDRFFVVGKGDDERVIIEAFEKRGVRDQLVLAGQQTREQLADAYAAMELFVFTSFTETQGITLVEAMAAGTPILALDGPGVREVVKTDHNGALLPKETTVQAFADQAHAFMRDTTGLKRLRVQALKSAQAFSRERCALKLIDLYFRAITDNQLKNGGTRTTLDRIVERLDAEWSLLSNKASAAFSAIVSDDAVETPQ